MSTARHVNHARVDRHMSLPPLQHFLVNHFEFLCQFMAHVSEIVETFSNVAPFSSESSKPFLKFRPVFLKIDENFWIFCWNRPNFIEIRKFFFEISRHFPQNRQLFFSKFAPICSKSTRFFKNFTPFSSKLTQLSFKIGAILLQKSLKLFRKNSSA